MWALGGNSEVDVRGQGALRGPRMGIGCGFMVLMASLRVIKARAPVVFLCTPTAARVKPAITRHELRSAKNVPNAPALALAVASCTGGAGSHRTLSG